MRQGRRVHPDRRRSDGLVSPVKTFSDMVFAEIVLTSGARYQVKPEHHERAIYVVAGEVEIVGRPGSFRRGRIDTAGTRRRGRAQGAGLSFSTTDADGRRALFRTPARLLELRLLLGRADRAGKDRLA